VHGDGPRKKWIQQVAYFEYKSPCIAGWGTKLASIIIAFAGQVAVILSRKVDALTIAIVDLNENVTGPGVTHGVTAKGVYNLISREEGEGDRFAPGELSLAAVEESEGGLCDGCQQQQRKERSKVHRASFCFRLTI
jgi:hypothetical protein